MKRFQKDPEVVSRATELAARILREIAMAADAGSAEIRLYFRQDWMPKDLWGNECGLGVHIECGREDTLLLCLQSPYTIEFPNTLPTVFDGLAKLMADAREPNSTVALQLKAFLNGCDNER
jgi:hypothetical protein